MRGRDLATGLMLALALLAMPFAARGEAPLRIGAPTDGTPRLSFELSVDPPQPQVGDTVHLTFAVGIDGTGGLPQYTLALGGEALRGDLGPVTHSGPLPDTVSFTLAAVAAGAAELVLRVNYESSTRVDGQCCVFQFVSDQSQAFRVPVIATLGASPTTAGSAAATPTPTVVPPAALHRVAVVVGSGEGNCPSGYPDRTVELYPTGRTAVSDENGLAVFDDVPDGDYEVRVAPPCRSGSCFPWEPVSVAGDDVEIALCPPLCTSQIFLEPESGPAGSEVSLEGACQFIHSGGTAPLTFGPIALGEVFGETAGDFRRLLTVPYVPPGVYEVSAADGVGLFTVTGDFPGCDGDCNGDLSVRIDELTRSVGIALHTADPAQCPVFRDGASIAQLVRAVRAALQGCAAIVPVQPTPALTDDVSCEECCADCTTPDCVAQCVGSQSCDLVTEWSGVITDAANGFPIEGAEVVVNGTSAFTYRSGFYSLTSVRDEICSGLDYEFEVMVRAPGYRTFAESFYRTPFPRRSMRDFDLAPMPQP